MNNETLVLLATAASLGFFHTLAGPDHYLPFIVMSQSRKWNTFRTILITILCGLGHVGSSIILGLIGIAFGVGMHKISFFDNVRGGIASWMLMAFGLAYLVWALRRYYKMHPHKHVHNHEDGSAHEHIHTHEHSHTHLHNADKKNITPWILFTIFVLGPCEPLIPLLMYPAAKNSMVGLVSVTVVFSLVTVITMVVLVLLAKKGFSLINSEKLERYTHIIAGVTIFLSGAAIVFLGL